ncbi:diaminopimelate decarboxylase [Dysgonomonas sp. Marseille-P4361]|uniref:diaminopimelate decarboxylase n=1 Tax=Dysgonomonas sp. Marseille-P4361 TaxID=2161820 RepID=UPI000D5577E1|nr:diaminopimelate decarboxylase [Dysgonomonas sp. Marseille-P4361]
MTKGNFPIEKLKGIETPFYYYNMDLLRKTLKTVKGETKKYGFHEHYAVKANANRRILEIVASEGFGVDCVSGNEIKAAVNAGFPASKIVFAGVGKTDKEINLALDLNIFCFNVESLPELEVINELANKKGKIAQVALRINPNIDAHTHEYITTGLNENKFGFSISALQDVLERLKTLKGIKLSGIHFHVGSQIEDLSVFSQLCDKVNELQDYFEAQDIKLEHINVGGGLGIDYNNPEDNLIPDFEKYFALFHSSLKLREGQVVHFELGRAMVAQSGALITRTTYVKEGEEKTFVIVDGGMTDLIRPALYQAYHKIENISSDLPLKKYDIVGPICESSDVFAKDYELNETKRGDILVIYSAGAYGEIMASQYNCRELPKAYYSDKI